MAQDLRKEIALRDELIVSLERASKLQDDYIESFQKILDAQDKTIENLTIESESKDITIELLNEKILLLEEHTKKQANLIKEMLSYPLEPKG